MTDKEREIKIYQCVYCGYEIIEDEVLAAKYNVLKRCIRCGSEGYYSPFEIITRKVKYEMD